METSVHAADNRRFARTIVVLLAAFGLVATQFAGFGLQAAHAAGVTGFITFSDGDGTTHQVSITDPNEQGADITIAGYEWLGDGTTDGPTFHISCSATLLDTNASLVEGFDFAAEYDDFEWPEGTTEVTIIDFDIHRQPGEGNPQECTPESFNGSGDGSLTVVKEVTGNDIPDGLDADDFEFSLVCDSETIDGSISLDGGTSGAIDVPAGTTDCTVTENDDKDADTTSWTIEGAGDDNATGNGLTTDAFDVDADDDITVTFTNDYDDGTPPGDGEVTVAKLVDGEPSEALDAFRFELVCGSMTEEFGLVDGGSATFDVDDGSSCSVEEVTTQDADGTSWVISGDAVGNGSGTQTTSFDVDEDDEITVTFTNAYSAVGGELEVDSDISIVKTATDGVDEDEDGALSVTLDADDEATVTYQYLITNEGEDALTDLSLVDDQLGDLSAAFVAAVTAQYGDGELPIDGAVLVEADHDVTQSSFTDDELVNVATVTALGTESGDEVSDEDNETIGLVKVLAEVEDKDEKDEKDEESVVKSKVEKIAFTGSDTTMLTGIGLTTALLGFAALLFTGRKRREE